MLGASAVSGNLGVAALAASQAHAVQQVANKLGMEVSITSLEAPPNPDVGGRIASVTNEPLSLKIALKNPRRVKQVLQEYALVLDAGEGDSFSDTYGWRVAARRLHFRSLCKERLLTVPQTYGPFNKMVWRFVAKRISRQLDMNWARDPQSIELLQEWGAPCKLATDVAFMLPTIVLSWPMEGGKPRVGLNVSGLLWKEGYSSAAAAASYRAEVRKLIRDLHGKATVHIIPHVTNPGRPGVDDDLLPTSILAREFPDVVAHPLAPSPEEAKGLIATMDLMVSPRMHAAIAGVSSGTPTIPLAYSRKCGPLFENIGYNETVEIAGREEPRFAAHVVNCLSDLPTLRVKAVAAADKARAKLQPWIDDLARRMGNLA